MVEVRFIREPENKLFHDLDRSELFLMADDVGILRQRLFEIRMVSVSLAWSYFTL